MTIKLTFERLRIDPAGHDGGKTVLGKGIQW